MKNLLTAAMTISVVAMVALVGCDPDIPERDGEPVDRVQPIFDPATGVIPLPNDAAMVDGRLPGLPGAEEGTAEGEFSNYLSDLRGWLPTTPIEIPFSGPLDVESLGLTADENEDEADGEETDSVRLYRVMDNGELERQPIGSLSYEEHEDGTSLVTVSPDVVRSPGDQFAVVVTKDVLGANSEPIVEPLPIFFAASPESLLDADGQPALDVLADDPETAQTLEGLRMMLEPVFNGLEAGVGDDDSLSRDDVAMAFRWTIVPDTVASFEPEQARVPIPNTAALDADGTFPAAATCEAGENTAQGHFDDYLAGLSGWPDATPITMPLSGPVDEDSIGPDDVQLWSNDGTGWERIENISVSYRDQDVDPCTGESFDDHILDVVPDDGMNLRHQYFAFATRDIEDTDGMALIPELLMYMALQPHDLVDEEGSSLVGSLSDEQAQGIQGLRDVVQPAMMAIEDETGLDHEDMAMVWNWFTWNDTFVLFDPTTGEVPFPNLLMIDQDDGTVNLPIPEDADPLTESILTLLNQRRDFSTHAPGWIPLNGKVDPETLDDAFYLAVGGLTSGIDPGLIDDEDYTVRYEEEWDRIVFEPLTSLVPNEFYVPILTQEIIGANGRPVQAPPLFVFIRNPQPLIDEDGESQIDALDNETAATLEAVRQGFNDNLVWILSQGMTGATRTEMAVLWAYGTEDPVQSLRQYRARTLNVLDERADLSPWRECDFEGDCDFGEDGDPRLLELGEEHPYFGDSDVMVDTSNLWAVYNGGEFMSAAVNIFEHAVMDGDERVGISVYLPAHEQGSDTCEPPYDAVIAQHGLGSDRSRGGVMAMANEVASYPGCAVTVAMDLPEHGGRADSAASPHPEDLPVDSGAEFLGPDLVGSKNNFVQAIVDLFTVTRAIEDGVGADSWLDTFLGAVNDGDPAPIEDEFSFSGEIGFIGSSLGGVVGVPFTALDPAVETVVIHTAGGRMKWILEGDEDGVSTIGAPLFDALGLELGDQDLFESLTLVQWLADRIDPASFASWTDGGHPTLSYDPGEETFMPTTGATCDENSDCPAGWMCDSVGEDDLCVEYVGASDLLLHMATGDRVIVNRSTQALAAELGVDLEATTFDDVNHAFMAVVDEDDDDFAAAQCARQQTGAWLQSGLVGEPELPEELTATACLAE